MYVSRQRRVENTTIFEPSTIVAELRSVLLKNIGLEFTGDIITGINSLAVTKFVDYIDYNESVFCIKLFTIQNSNGAPIFIAISYIEQWNAFLLIQGSIGRLLPTRDLELFFNNLFSRMQIETCEDYAYYAKVRKYDSTNISADEIQMVITLQGYVKKEITQGYEQLSLFDSEDSVGSIKDFLDVGKSKLSEDVYNDFGVDEELITYYSTDLELTYKKLSRIVPKETIQFTELTTKQAVVCEMICSAICHQMNWDFLRDKILKKTLSQPNWIEPIYISTIKTKDVEEIFVGYSKIERVRAEERAELLRILGTTFVGLPNGFDDIFFREDGVPQDAAAILKRLSSCTVFSNDPVEKKLQLLLQKISVYKGFEKLGNKCRPTIDYHIIRSFLRRGFLIPKTKHAREIVTIDAFRAEQTVGAIRKHCAEIITLLSEITGQSVAVINNIEWWLGRSVCIEGRPLCNLDRPETEWLSHGFDKCPFSKVFCKSETEGTKLQQYFAPKYKGNSY